MEKKILPDTPWHIGYAKKQEDDPRRHKTRCLHYKKGICETRCIGSSHCTLYEERELAKYKHTSYRLIHNNEVFVKNDVRRFCLDSGLKEKHKRLEDILVCPICKKKLEEYPPLKYMAKKCLDCRTIYVNEDVYKTYTEEINRSLANSALCLAGLNE